ncbi:MAG: DUF3604 domain-containing protein [Pseudomonadota bacterium]
MYRALFILWLPALALADEYSPFVDSPPRQVFFGDTHLHSAFSSDAGLIGTTLQPADAYRFARGETVTSSSGVKARISRPLDFLVLSDHAESLGLPIAVKEAMPALLDSPWGREVYKLFEAGRGPEGFLKWAFEGMLPGVDPLRRPEINAEVWRRQAETADSFNEPGLFTALIGFEWTNTANSKNLHRVVILRDDASRATQVVPFSSWESPDPEDLWRWMQDYEDNTGGSILAIPHNANLSNGIMFGPLRWNGEAFDESYAAKRAHYEPLVEVTQIKGDGEAHPLLSPDDEFADFGNWDWSDIGGRDAKTPDMLPYEYARSALQQGLMHERALGVNPFRFGMIGASDSHTGMSTVREDNYYGKFASSEPRPGRGQHVVVKSPTDDRFSLRTWNELAAGLAGVWATENTREALFDAMRRREVYATTGSRITLRFFGGWEYAEADLMSPDMPQLGYAGGVPMGGLLTAQPAQPDASPTFMVAAARDPDGANLDRIQIVKGWVDEGGTPRETIYDVALSDGRTLDGQGRAPSVGSTVDLETATYANSIGSTELRTLWRDPDFDSAQAAFYYARVLEIPKPSWQTYDTVRLRDSFPEGVTRVVQDRAYSSPIWYQN